MEKMRKFFCKDMVGVFYEHHGREPNPKTTARQNYTGGVDASSKEMGES